MAVKPNEISVLPNERLAEEIRPGDKIVARVLLDEHGEEYAKPYKRGSAVKDVSECPGRWRTHVHIDGGCWDGRTRLVVA